MLDLRYAGALDRKISRIVTHPDYDENYYDVALLHLESPLSLSYKVQPICLPCESQPDPASLARASVTSQGWGKDNEGEVGGALTQIDVTVRSKAECDYKYNNTKSVQSRLRVRKFLPDLVSSSLFCADNNLNQRIGVCHGDSGGPSIIRSVIIMSVWGFFGLKLGQSEICNDLGNLENFLGAQRN